MSFPCYRAPQTEAAPVRDACRAGRTHEACSASSVLFKYPHDPTAMCKSDDKPQKVDGGHGAQERDMRGAHASRTGSRASAGAPAKKAWNSSFLSCRERLGSQSAATTASHTALVMCLATGI